MSAIEVNSQGHFVVIGELNFHTVPQLQVRGKQLIDASPQPIFELHGITSSDHSAVALLISWARYAKALGKAILFMNLSDQLMALVTETGLSNVLPIRMTDN